MDRNGSRVCGKDQTVSVARRRNWLACPLMEWFGRAPALGISYSYGARLTGLDLREHDPADQKNSPVKEPSQSLRQQTNSLHIIAPGRGFDGVAT